MGGDNKVALIAIFGATGTGKTTFVNDASGGELRVGHDPHACTKDVEQSPVFQVHGRNVVLFDTPGFDDTHLSDTEILKRISGFLVASYKEGYKLTGIIYMHRITDIRVGGISRRTFNVVRKLCGKDSLSNLLLVTNMWSDPPTPEQIERETVLSTHVDFFKPAIEEGATMVRRTHKDRQSAHDIIRLLLQKDPVALEVQHELVDQGKTLSDTGAGREVEHELIMATEKHKADMAELKTEMEEALRDRDERTQSELAQYQKEAKAAEEKRQAELEALRKGYDDEQARWQKQVEQARAEQMAMEARQETLRKELEETRRQQEEAAERQREQARAEKIAMEARQEAVRRELEEARIRQEKAVEHQREQARAEKMAMEARQEALRREFEEARRRQEEAAEHERREFQNRINGLEHRVQHQGGGCIIS